MKDWTGNRTSSIIAAGGHNYSDYDREKHDFYATDPKAIDMLFKVEHFNKNIWECACGLGHLSKRMELYGKRVFSTDLIDRGYGRGNFNFLECNEKFEGDIITNPPYKYAEDFIFKALQLTSNKVAMLLRIQFLEGIRRYDNLFTKVPPKKLYVFSSRIGCAMNGDFGSHSTTAVCYAWWIWEKGYTGDTVIKWIKEDKSIGLDI